MPQTEEDAFTAWVLLRKMIARRGNDVKQALDRGRLCDYNYSQC